MPLPGFLWFGNMGADESLAVGLHLLIFAIWIRTESRGCGTMQGKTYWVAYQRSGGGPIVLEGPFLDHNRAFGARQRVRINMEPVVKVSLPFVAQSEIQAVKRARYYL